MGEGGAREWRERARSGCGARECNEGVRRGSVRRASSPRAVAVVGRHPLTPAPRRGAATLAAPRAAAVPSAECHAPKSSWSGGENCSHDGCLPRLAAGESWWTFETSSSRSAPVYSPSYPNSESGATAWTRWAASKSPGADVTTDLPVGQRTGAELPSLTPDVQRVMSRRTRRTSSFGSVGSARHSASSAGPAALRMAPSTDRLLMNRQYLLTR